MKTLFISVERTNKEHETIALINEFERLGLSQVSSVYHSMMDSPSIYFIGDITEKVKELIKDDRVSLGKVIDDPKHVLTMMSMNLATPEQKAEVERLVEKALNR